MPAPGASLARMGAILPAPIRSQLLCRKGNASFRVGAAAMQGFRTEMEDEHSICLSLEGHPDVSLFAVYDGHAGQKVSEYLSKKLPDVLAKLSSFDDLSLTHALLDFDTEIGKQDFRNMGSTCVFTLVEPDHSTSSQAWKVTAVNVGDSRVMIVRANGTLVSMTEDHKPDDKLERARIIKAGGSVSNNRVDGGLAMSRAMGDYMYKINSRITQLEQKVIPLPDITHEVIYAGDRLLVVCDGIVERINNKDVANYVHAKHKEIREDPAQVMRELLFYSLARGSTDNQSAIMVCFEDGTGYEKPDQFIAGPLSEFTQDRKFLDAYLKNANAWGQTAESLRPLIAEAEASMQKDWRNVSKPEDSKWPFPAWLIVLLLAIVGYALWFRWTMQQEELEY